MQVTIYKNCGYYWSVIPYGEDVDRELSRERYSLGNNWWQTWKEVCDVEVHKYIFEIRHINFGSGLMVKD